jgi:hypothetical protein
LLLVVSSSTPRIVSANSSNNQRKIFRNNTGSLPKAGMLATMGTAVYSGFAGGKPARFIHPWAGLALVGFAIWHQRINLKRKRTV